MLNHHSGYHPPESISELGDLVLQEKAILVQIHVQTWTGRLTDRESTADARKDDKSIAAVVRHVVPKKSADAVVASAKSARRAIQSVTLPWGNTESSNRAGFRLLAASKMEEFDKIVTEQREKFFQEVERFVDEYKRQRRKLSKEKRDAVPSVSDVRNKFNIVVEYTTIPSGKDLRIPFNNDKAIEIAESIDDATFERYSAGVRDLYSQMLDSLSRLKEQIESGRYGVRSNTYNHVAFLSELAAHLNILEDAQFSRVVHILDNEILIYSADSIREEEALQLEVVEKLNEVISILDEEMD